MTKEEIIKMAREAGMADVCWESELSLLLLTRFAGLVAAAEREACAKVCEDFADGTSAYEVHHRFAAYKCADLIRKRGEDESIS